MAKLVDLISGFSQMLDVPAKSVNVIAMHLRREGLISKGGRGRGGAEMTSADAANLLIGIMGAEQLKDAPTIVKDLGSYILESFEDKSAQAIQFDPSAYYNIELGESFSQSLIKIIEYFIDHPELTKGFRHQWDLLLTISLLPKKDVSFIEFFDGNLYLEEETSDLDESRKIKASYFNPYLQPVTAGDVTPAEALSKLKMLKHIDLNKKITVSDDTIRNIARLLTDRPVAKWNESEDVS